MNTPKLIYVRHNKGILAPQIPRGTIAYVELTIVFKGTLEYGVDRQRVTLCDGDAVLIPQGAIREREAGQEDADYISFNFLVDEPLDMPCFLPSVLSSDVRMLIAACDEIYKIHFADHKEPVAHLLGCLLVTLRNNLQRQSTHPLVENIKRYLHENISQKITLSDIAKHTFFSAIYCDSVFKRETGRSIIDYLLEERINGAKQLLTEGTLSLQQISESVGFADYNYFCRTFKKRTGYTPVQYRKMIRKSLT